MIKELSEVDMNDIFFDLLAEVECGNHFDFKSQKHHEWLKKRISVNFYRGMKFFGYFSKEDVPIGFAAILIDDGPEGVCCFGHSGELMDIAVFPKYRGDGIGSKLLVYVENYCRDKKVSCLYMTTYAKDYKVISFYGKNGFVPVATLPDVHGPNDEGKVFMRKILL